MTIHTYSFPTQIHFGPGARNRLPGLLTAAGSSRPMIVTDRGVAALPLFDELRSLLTDNGLTPGAFSDFEGNPIASQVTAGVTAYRNHDADAIIALGGGAAIDVAKAIALMIHHPGDLFDYEDGKPGALPVDQPIPYMVALPTTAGTGSEVGRSTVISVDDTKIKKIIFDPRLLPRVALADPELTLGLPPSITAATGMDALAHNVEAFLSQGFHPMADGIALEGVRLVADSLETCVHNGSDLDARGKLMIASLMGAVAFQKGLGVTHSLAHPLSTVCDLHHGLANGIMLPYAMRFNARGVPDRFVRLAAAAGAATHDADGFIDWLIQLRARINIPHKLTAVGVTTDHLDALVNLAVHDVCHSCNPIPVTADDFRQMYTEALSMTDRGHDAPLRIGLSACFFHADPQRAIFKGKTLQYTEQKMAHSIMSGGALAYLIPSPAEGDRPIPISLDDLVRDLDAVVLQGGSDLAPQTYNEQPIGPWEGDPIRDRYEIALLRTCIAHNKPVLGVCRGAQLINVEAGGTLYQDITTQVPDALIHRDWPIYESNTHDIHIEPGSHLAALYNTTRAHINSVHHQAIKDLGHGLHIEARSSNDGIIEAIKRHQPDPHDPWVLAVQWHPEFQDPHDASLLDPNILLRDFLDAARRHR